MGVKYNFTTDDYKTENGSSFKEKSLIKFHRNNDYSEANQHWCSAIARFIQSGYALIFEKPLGSLQLKGFLMIKAK
jgi:hypothetical protein